MKADFCYSFDSDISAKVVGKAVASKIRYLRNIITL